MRLLKDFVKLVNWHSVGEQLSQSEEDRNWKLVWNYYANTKDSSGKLVWNYYVNTAHKHKRARSVPPNPIEP